MATVNLLFSGVSFAFLIVAASALPQCEVCHLRNAHTLDISTSQDFTASSACRQYADASCCSVETANTIGLGGDSPLLYGEQFSWNRCGAVSAECNQWFINEQCLYECDVNAGKFREDDNCTEDSSSAWKMVGMPMKASQCDSWYSACADDLFCVGESTHFFDTPGDGACNQETDCKKFKDIYLNAQSFCEDLWDGAFTYESDETKAYSFVFPEGHANPNDVVLPDKGFPTQCSLHDPNLDGCPSAFDRTLEAEIDQLQRHVFGGLGTDVDCAVCHLRYHHKDVASATTFEANTACAQYADNSCCTAETALNVHNDVLYGDEYRWDRCGALSSACQAHFVSEACFYECDQHAGKFRAHPGCDSDQDGNAWQMLGMPIKASDCDKFYEDCKDDNFCVDDESKSYFDLPTCDFATQCRPFSEIYEDGKEMCEKLWDHSFKYETNEQHAYTWSFDEGAENPNNKVLPSVPYPEQCPGFDPDVAGCHTTLTDMNERIDLVAEKVDSLESLVFDGAEDHDCEVCHLRYHHKDVSSPTAFDHNSACRQYSDNSCCTAETALNVHTDSLYGVEYKWDRCGPMGAKCQAHFVAEACFYECDHHAGKYRKYETCKDDAGESNGWQMLGMPIKASECDKFYEDCKDELFCVEDAKSFFDLPTCDLLTQCKKFSDIYSGGKEMCEKLWDGSFTYATDEEKAYTWIFPEGASNPNNLVYPGNPFPIQCPEHDPDLRGCSTSFTQVEDQISKLQAVIKNEHEQDDHESSDNNTLATVGLLLGLVGILLGAAALFVAVRASNTAALACLSGNNKVGGHVRLTDPDVDNATMNRTKGPAISLDDQI